MPFKNIYIAGMLLAAQLAAQTAYNYDNLNRLTRVSYSDGTTIVYTYDAVGNRLSQVVTSPAASTPPTPPASATANVLLTFTPSPVPLSTDKQWHYSLQLKEVNGVGVTLTDVIAGGADQTMSIASWFGSTRINPLGQLAATLMTPCAGTCTSTSAPIVDYIWQFTGTDDNGHSGVIWRGTALLGPPPAASVPQTSGAYVITTVAGNGTPGYSGDGGPANSAELNDPYDVAVDAAGNLFIVDLENHRIRKLATNGTITTVAGTGVSGFSGDGGPAKQAQLASPAAVVVDTAGNLFIADTGNQRIRKVTTDGVIRTVAGNGASGYSGDGGQASSTELSNPGGLAVDAAGNFFIADVGNQRIRKVTTDGVIRTVAGNGGSGYSGDGGLATSAELYVPSSVAVTASGDLYIADQYNSRIRHVTPTGTITTFAGNGPTIPYPAGAIDDAQIPFPAGVAVDAVGNIFVTDGGSKVLKVEAATGAITTIAGTGVRGYSGDGGPATGAELAGPFGLTVDAAGNIYVADTFNYVIRKLVLQPTSSGP